MKAKIFVITIIALLISTSFIFAEKRSNVNLGEKLFISHSNTPYHPILENPGEPLNRVRIEGEGKSQRVPPEPDQDRYFVWQDNFEDEDDIFYYGAATYIWYCPDEADEFGVRFTARRAGALIGSWFYFYDGTATDVNVNVYDDDGDGYPGALLGSVTVPVDPAFSWQYVDLSTLGIDVTTTDDFFISFSIDAGDLQIISDDGLAGANRSVEILPGTGTWTYVVDDYAGVGYEWCIDAVIGVPPAPWVSSPTDRWLLVDDEYYSPIHSWWIDDDTAFEGMNWLTSPPFMCPDGYGQMQLEYYYNSDLVDASYPDDDYYSFYIGKTEDGIDWHSSTYNAYQGATSWYAGSEITHLYGENAIYYLYTPDIDLSEATTANLTCMIDYDTEEPGGEDPPYDGWDIATVQISTDNWATKTFLEDPDHPYNVTIAFSGYWNTNNPADTLSYPGWGGVNPDGWFEANFDLVDYIGEVVQIRFTLASDPYTTTEGFWVDNVDITVDEDIVFSDYDEANLIPDPPIIPYEELIYDYGTTNYEWVLSEVFDITAYQGYEIVLAARVKLDTDHSGGDGLGYWIDDVSMYGSNLPPHDMANMFNVILNLLLIFICTILNLFLNIALFNSFYHTA